LVNSFSVIGGPEEQKRGRAKGDKKLVVLALEIVGNGVGRAYAEIIEHASSKELGAFLNKYVSKDAQVVSYEWKGYTPLKKVFTKLGHLNIIKLADHYLLRGLFCYIIYIMLN